MCLVSARAQTNILSRFCCAFYVQAFCYRDARPPRGALVFRCVPLCLDMLGVLQFKDFKTDPCIRNIVNVHNKLVHKPLTHVAHDKGVVQQFGRTTVRLADQLARQRPSKPVSLKFSACA